MEKETTKKIEQIILKFNDGTYKGYNYAAFLAMMQGKMADEYGFILEPVKDLGIYWIGEELEK